MNSSLLTISEYLAKDDLNGKGDMVLTCHDGEIRGIRGVIISMASPVLAGALECKKVDGMHQINVDGTCASWLVILSHLYPLSRIEITFEDAADLLPLAHKYDIGSIMIACDVFLIEKIPSLSFSVPESPAYGIKWISLAAEFHLDKPYKLMMERMQQLILSKELDPAHFFSTPCVKPRICPYVSWHATTNCNCQKWCTRCKKWSCTHYKDCIGKCINERINNGCTSTAEAGSCTSLADYPPKSELHSSIKALDSKAMADILSVLIVHIAYAPKCNHAPNCK